MSFTARRLLIELGGASAAQQVDSYILNNLSPLLYYKFNEESGNLIDYGSEGADGTNTAMTQGSTSIVSPDKSYLFDGATSYITVLIASIPNVAALGNQRWAVLCNPLSLGESDAGVIFTANANFFRLQSTNRIRASIACATTSASAISNVNQISDCIGVPCWFFMDYDDTNSLGNGRKIRLFKGLNGTVTQLTLGTDIASVGAVTAPVSDLIVGNRTVVDWTFNGTFARLLVASGTWTTAEMQALIDKSGV